jgi:glycosyltransferase involved in cell wall biosynthesis
MRIAFISGMAGAPWGGSEFLWSNAAQKLLEAGHSVFVSVAEWPETPSAVVKLRNAGALVDKRRRGRARIGQWIFKKIVGKKESGFRANASWEKIKRFFPDLVCISHGGTVCGLEWMTRCRDEGIHYVSIAQANFEQWWPDDRQFDAVAGAYLEAEKSYFVSKANLDLFQRQIGTLLENSEVVSNPFNVSWDAAPAWPESSEFRFACVGRLDPAAKGQDLIFQVLSLPKWRDRAVTVTLFGKGPCENSLRRLAALEGVLDRVTFAGHVADVEEVWKSHHALLLPSRYEGLPLCLVEAMLCGRPSIVTDVAGNREPLEDGVTGFIAESPSVEHLDAAMERAWERRHEWEAIGRMAALSIRRLIPRDPAQAFAEKLLAVACRTELH